MSTLNETALVGFLSLDFSFVALVDLVSQPLSPPLHADLLNLYALHNHLSSLKPNGK